MGEQAGPVYRAAGPNRTAAWVVLVVSLAVVIGVNASGAGPIVGGVIGAVGVIVALLALSSIRFQVRAEPEHLVVCAGGPVRRIPWSEIEGFGIDEKRGRTLFAVLPGERRLLLPIPEVRTGRITAREARDALQRYWKAHRC